MLISSSSFPRLFLVFSSSFPRLFLVFSSSLPRLFLAHPHFCHAPSPSRAITTLSHLTPPSLISLQPRPIPSPSRPVSSHPRPIPVPSLPRPAPCPSPTHLRLLLRITQRFAARESTLQSFEGFRGFQLLRRDGDDPDGFTHSTCDPARSDQIPTRVGQIQPDPARSRPDPDQIPARSRPDPARSQLDPG